MASRRMISTAVFSSDKFMDMQPVTQLLYLQIGLNADDDGFTNRINAIRRVVGATQENVNELIDAGFIYIFDSGVAVDMLWNVNNSVRKDRYHPTVYQEERQLLSVEEDGRYTLTPSDDQMDTTCQPNDNQMDTEVRLGKDRLDNIPSNIQTTSCKDIASYPQQPVDNSDNVGNAEPEEGKLRPASLDGMDLYNLPGKDAFAIFRDEYPRHQGALRDVQTAWVTAVAGGAAPGDLVMACRKYAAECKEKKTDQQYIKMPQNFISTGTWKQYMPRYLPSCPHCHGAGVYEGDNGMIMCDCDRRYG